MSWVVVEVSYKATVTLLIESWKAKITRTSPESHAFNISNVSFWIAEKKMKMQDELLT